MSLHDDMAELRRACVELVSPLTRQIERLLRWLNERRS